MSHLIQWSHLYSSLQPNHKDCLTGEYEGHELLDMLIEMMSHMWMYEGYA